MSQGHLDTRVPACMGGWCTKRGHCQHYHAADRQEPSERLCAPGFDGIGLELPVVIGRLRGDASRALEASLTEGGE